MIIKMQMSDLSDAPAFFRDMACFIPYSRPTIDESPLQVYAGASVFAPQKRVMWQSFIKQIKTWVPLLHQVDTDWSPSLYTLNETGMVNCIALSPTNEGVQGFQNNQRVHLIAIPNRLSILHLDSTTATSTYLMWPQEYVCSMFRNLIISTANDAPPLKPRGDKDAPMADVATACLVTAMGAA